MKKYMNIENVCNQQTLNELLINLRLKFQQLFEEVNWVVQDQEFLKNYGTIYFIVDFYHIYDFAHPFQAIIEESKRNKQLPTNETLGKLVQYQSALTFLFYGLKSKYPHPILLPPHVKELKSHIRKNIENHNNLLLRLEIMRNLRTAILTPEDELLLAKAKEEYEKNKSFQNIDEDIYKSLLNLVLTKFQDILSLITGLTQRGNEVITNLVDEQLVIIDWDKISDFQALIQEVMLKKKSKVFDVFNHLRKDQYAQNDSDAQVIDIIIALNIESTNKKLNNIYYFLSDSENVMKLFHPDQYKLNLKAIELIKAAQEDISGKGIQNSIHRTTNVFLDYMMTAENHIDINDDKFFESKQKTIDNLIDRRSLILHFNTLEKTFLEILKKCPNNCSQCKSNIKTECGAIKSEIVEWDELYNKRISSTILSNRFVILKPAIDYVETFRDTIEEGIITIISFLTDKDKKLETRITEQRAKLDQSYFKLVETISDKMLDFSTEIQQVLVYGIKPFRRIPFSVNFENAEITNILEEARQLFENSQNKPSLEEIKRISTRIWDLTSDNSIGIERQLLLAILNYNFNQLAYAFQFLDDYCGKENVAKKEDFLLIKLLVMHQFAINSQNKLLYNQSLDLSRNLLNQFPEDSRFHYMLGVIIGRGIQSSIEMNNKIEDSIMHFKNALQILKSENNINELYEATIWNSISFANCLFQSPELHNILEANKALDNISRLVNENEWDANFLDTKGLVLYYQSRLESKEEIKNQLLKVSQKYLEKAFAIAKSNKYLPYEISDIVKHIKLIKD